MNNNASNELLVREIEKKIMKGKHCRFALPDVSLDNIENILNSFPENKSRFLSTSNQKPYYSMTRSPVKNVVYDVSFWTSCKQDKGFLLILEGSQPIDWFSKRDEIHSLGHFSQISDIPKTNRLIKNIICRLFNKGWNL